MTLIPSSADSRKRRWLYFFLAVLAIALAFFLVVRVSPAAAQGVSTFVRRAGDFMSGDLRFAAGKGVCDSTGANCWEPGSGAWTGGAVNVSALDAGIVRADTIDAGTITASRFNTRAAGDRYCVHSTTAQCGMYISNSSGNLFIGGDSSIAIDRDTFFSSNGGINSGKYLALSGTPLYMNGFGTHGWDSNGTVIAETGYVQKFNVAAASLPTCSASYEGAVAYDTTNNTLVVCTDDDGSFNWDNITH